MLAFLILASPLIMSSSAETPVVFACSWVETEQDDPFFMDVVELIAERRRDETGESWRLEWADERTAHARAYTVEPGRFGERTRIEWSESGEVNQAFVSNLPGSEEGRELVFISVSEGKQDGPPGYACLTAPPEDNRS